MHLRSSVILWCLLCLVSPALGFDCTLKTQGKELARLSMIPTEAELGQWVSMSLKRHHGVVTTGPLVQRVQVVADRLRQVVRKRPEILYTVEVLNTFEKGACAYPGGYIFLTKGLVELTTNEHELAIVIAHEFAHVATGQTDQPIEYELAPRLEKRLIELGAVGRGFASEMRTRFCHDMTTDEIIRLKELQADRDAIIYVSLAGYHAASAYTILDKVGAIAASSCQPSQEERKTRIAQQVQGIVDQLEKFHAGVRFYVQQEYEHAIEAFKTFLSAYPGREVHHNLATAYHRLALSAYNPSRRIPAKCSLALESETQAHSLGFRMRTLHRPLEESEKYRRYLTEAITQYMHALQQDPTYTPAAVNLACAYLEQEKYTRAQGELEDALQTSPAYAAAYNNLGVAFLLQNDRQKALTQFDTAIRLETRYADPYFNLGLLWEAEGQPDRARLAWQSYTQLLGPGNNVYVRLARTKLGLPEEDGRTASARSDAEIAALPVRPGQSVTSLTKPEREVLLFTVCPGKDERSCLQVRALVYERIGITVLADEQVIRQVVISSPSKQTTARGISLGQAEEQVLQKYGLPNRIEDNPASRYLVYDPLRLAVAIRERKVVSWFLF